MIDIKSSSFFLLKPYKETGRMTVTSNIPCNWEELICVYLFKYYYIL